ncbi:MAG: istB-like binding family protein [Betaproteobacteria bacterium]|nr:istB-like binding family protein [Betaproteobacteria bacterium]
MNLQHERIAALCTKLKLERIAPEWPPLAEQAARDEASFAEFLERLLTIEDEARAERQRQTLLKLATLPAIKTLEQYDFGFASGAPRPQIQELAACRSSSAPRTSCCWARPAWARPTSPRHLGIAQRWRASRALLRIHGRRGTLREFYAWLSEGQASRFSKKIGEALMEIQRKPGLRFRLIVTADSAP